MPLITGMHHVSLIVNDTGRALAFYHDGSLGCCQLGTLDECFAEYLGILHQEVSLRPDSQAQGTILCSQ